MLVKDAEKLAYQLLQEHGLDNWTYETNNRKRTLGLCFSQYKRIELSVHFIENNRPEVVRDTLLHEIAHAIVGSEQGHNAVWQEMAEQLGCTPKRKSATAVMPPGPWQATCRGCNRLFSKHRKPKYISGNSCALCGPKLGRLFYEYKAPRLTVPKGAAAMEKTNVSSK
ncbi:MAG TPA: SprT-like domain-containing protein [Drouetiella sp.]